jgi:hypothetical protein
MSQCPPSRRLGPTAAGMPAAFQRPAVARAVTPQRRKLWTLPCSVLHRIALYPLCPESPDLSRMAAHCSWPVRLPSSSPPVRSCRRRAHRACCAASSRRRPRRTDPDVINRAFPAARAHAMCPDSTLNSGLNFTPASPPPACSCTPCAAVSQSSRVLDVTSHSHLSRCCRPPIGRHENPHFSQCPPSLQYISYSSALLAQRPIPAATRT